MPTWYGNRIYDARYVCARSLRVRRTTSDMVEPVVDANATRVAFPPMAELGLDADVVDLSILQYVYSVLVLCTSHNYFYSTWTFPLCCDESVYYIIIDSRVVYFEKPSRSAYISTQSIVLFNIKVC